MPKFAVYDCEDAQKWIGHEKVRDEHDMHIHGLRTPLLNHVHQKIADIAYTCLSRNIVAQACHSSWHVTQLGECLVRSCTRKYLAARRHLGTSIR